VPALFAGAQRGQRRGGNPPAPAFPWRGNGKGGDQTSLLPPAVRAGLAMAGTPLVECVRSLYHFSLRHYYQPIMSIRSIRFPKVLPAPPTPLPCFYPHSSWARDGPGASGVRSKAQVHHHGDGPGLLGAAILRAISKGSKLPNAVTRTRRWMSLLTKTSRCLPTSAAINSCWFCSSSCIPAVARNGLPWRRVRLLPPWPATQPPPLPLSARYRVTAYKLLH
jgi:hypothetical protein